MSCWAFCALSVKALVPVTPMMSNFRIRKCDQAAINNDRSDKPFQHHLVKARGANLTSMACSLICSSSFRVRPWLIPEVFLHLPRIQLA